MTLNNRLISFFVGITFLTHSLTAVVYPVYFGTGGEGGILRASFDSETGSLSPIDQAAETRGAGFIAIHPNGLFLYSTKQERGERIGSVASWSIEEDGSLTSLNELSLDISIFTADPQTGDLDFVSTSPLAEPEDDTSRMSASEIRNHPNGRFLYAALRDLDDRGRDAIVLFEREPSTGAISRKETFPAQVMIPRNFNLSPEGKWMLVGGARSSDLAIFKVDPRTGALLPDPEIVEAPSGPICIEFLSVGNSSP